MVMLMDSGGPPPINVSQEAHAGCLSFELSHGLQRIVVNCGLPGTNRGTWRQVARATAAHSTVVFNDTSSCRFLDGVQLRQRRVGAEAEATAHLAKEAGGLGPVVVLEGDHLGFFGLRTRHGFSSSGCSYGRRSCGRLRFGEATSSAPFPSAIVIFRDRWWESGR